MSQKLLLCNHPNDSTVAQELQAFLEALGYSLTQDPELADRMVFLASQAATKSREVFDVWFSFYALPEPKPILVLMLELTALPTALTQYPRLAWHTPEQRTKSRLEDACNTLVFTPENARTDTVVTAPQGTAPHPPYREMLSQLHQAIRQRAKIALTDEQITEGASQQPENADDYRLKRILSLCSERYGNLEDRFINLTLLVDDSTEAQRHASPRFSATSKDLREFIFRRGYGAIIVLGAPGAGKTTLLQRLEMDVALEGLRGERDYLAFYVPLNTYGRSSNTNPLAWLEERWRPRMQSGVGDLKDWLQRGKLLLLLDGLNEMARDLKDVHSHQKRVQEWRDFLDNYIHHTTNRAVFTCRTIDYQLGLSSLPDNPIYALRLEELTEAQVHQYLRDYAPQHAETTWRHLSVKPDLLKLYRVPYLLRLLTDLLNEVGEIPTGRADTFTRLVQRLILQAWNKQPPVLTGGTVITLHDIAAIQEALNNLNFRHYLPDQAILINALSKFALNIQTMFQGAPHLSYMSAIELIANAASNQVQGDQVLSAGYEINVLNVEFTPEYSYRFFHHLLQEYFAARRMAQFPNYTLIESKWHVDDLEPFERVILSTPDIDPIPQLPSTGWEVTTVMAAALTNPADTETFIRNLIGVNLPYAAYCAAAPDVRERVSAELLKELQDRLIERCQHPQADLRARIEAAYALGELGDPRFVRAGRYILPPLIKIAGGEYPYGGDAAARQPDSFTYTLDSFEIGQFPVTNAEYALFIADGGYQNERWWRTEAALRWLRGQEDFAEDKREWWERIQRWRSELNTWKSHAEAGTLAAIGMSPLQYANRSRLASMTDEEFEKELDSWYIQGKPHYPTLWSDPKFNRAAQPVVGVTFYEAQAYCEWLSQLSDWRFRLPTEIEREAATRGREGRAYAYGDTAHWSKDNTYETHLRCTTPVGVFPEGATPDGVHHLSGNVWEWTSSLYRPYPYDPSDGREVADDRLSWRVVRGGSWYHEAHMARGAYRVAQYRSYHPNDNVGFRVVCDA
ncbi:MAG: hypothetical protein OHK0023_09060 [Anaerolineae bacterium]